MIKIDKNTLFKAYLGKQQIKKIYFGKDLIYQAPSEGLEYEYDDATRTCKVIGIGDCGDTHIIIPSHHWDIDTNS